MINLLEYQKNLQERQIKPVNLIHGEEEYLVKALIDKIKERMPVRVLWGDELSLEDFIHLIGTLGMFAREEVIFVHRAEDFFRGIKDYKSLFSHLEKMGSKRVFFYVGYKLGERELQKEPFFSLSKLGEVIYAGKLDKKKVKDLVKNKLQKEGISIEEPALEYLLEATSYQLMTLKGETEKLILYGEKNLTLEDIRSIVPAEPELSLFDFADGVFLRDYEKALSSLDSLLRAGTHPLQALSLLVNYALKLYTVKSLIEQGWDTDKALSEVDIKHKFQLLNFKKYLRENSLESLQSLLRRLHFLDLGIKVYFWDPAEAIREFVVEYMLNEEGTYYPTDTGDEDRSHTEP